MFKNKFKKYLKLKSNEIIKRFGFKIEKLSNLEIEINKVSRVKNINTRIKILKKLLIDYPQSSILHLHLIQCLHKVGDVEKFFHFEQYNLKRKQQLIDTGLSNLNLELIWQGMITGSLGNHYPIESLINANNLGLRQRKKLSVLFNQKMKLRNKHLFKYFNNQVNLITDSDDINLLSSISNILELPLGICVPFEKSCPSLDAASNITQFQKNANNDNAPFFKLTDNDFERGKKILIEYGLPKDAWYVTIHARELGYRNENKKNTTDDFRNTELNSYLKAIKYIASLGGWVFRMGDSSMKNLNAHQNVIDYANSNIKSEFMDVFLGATSKFCIGSSSGYYHIPFMFSVPVLFTNSPRFEEYYGLRKNDLYLPRMLKYKNTDKKLKLEEFMKLPIGIYNNQLAYLTEDLDIISNTEEEIYHATKEMINVLDKKNSTDYKSENQKSFLKLAKNKSNEYFKEYLHPQANISEFFINNEN